MTSRITELLREMALLSHDLNEAEREFFKLEATRPTYLASLIEGAPFQIKSVAARENYALSRPEYNDFVKAMADAKANYFLRKRDYELAEKEYFAQLSADKRDLLLETKG